MIVVGSDKGSPGVTTLAAALALAWPNPGRLLVEADPAGADLPLRLAAPGGTPLPVEPSLAGVAAAVRAGQDDIDLMEWTQPTAVGVPLLPGPLSPETFAAALPLLPAVFAAADRCSGTVIVDAGRLQPNSPVLPAARAATCVVLVVRGDLAGLHHARERVAAMVAALGDPTRDRHPLCVVVRAPAGHTQAAQKQLLAVLETVGCGQVPVVGAVPDDPRGAQMMWDAAPPRRLERTRLVSAAAGIARAIIGRYPAVVDEPTRRRSEHSPVGAQWAAAVVRRGGRR